MRPFLPTALLLVLGLTCLPGPARADIKESTPGLVLATEGRYATCDMLLFLPDGTRLFACGDDKVVRRYEVKDDGSFGQVFSPLRWPVAREQRGSIFAMAFSPDADFESLAIGGFGARTGAVFVLDRRRGQVQHTLDPVPSTQPTWSIAFSPSGKHLVYGTNSGEIFTWNLGAKQKTATLLPETRGKSANLIRHISFLSNSADETRFAFVAEDGRIRVGDVSKPTTAPTTLSVAFELPNLYRVASSPDRRWLAATPGGQKEGKTKQLERAELIDLRAALAGQVSRKFLDIPKKEGDERLPHCLAFDPNSARLAVGCRVHPKKGDFYREKGGLVFVFDLTTNKPSNAVLDIGYRPDAVAFRPTPKGSSAAWKNHLATAGGNNHEVRVWDLSEKGSVVDVMESPGSCLWGVALTKPNKENRIPYLAWQEKRADPPSHPNKWGAGEWRVLDLKKKSILPRAPKDFEPLLPLDRGGAKGDWRVEPTNDPKVWRVVGPGKTNIALDSASGLFDPSVYNFPRCYTFLPYTDKTAKAPVLLAVGHTWGVSLYECRPASVKVARVMFGHEGEVMSVAPSADGMMLVTASRDQTLCGWSLAPWPTQRELGATFENKNGKLVVKEVSAGSPAWDPTNPMTGGEDDLCRLSDGEEVDFISFIRGGKRFYFDAHGRHKEYTQKYLPALGTAEKIDTDKAIELLAATLPNAEMIFIKRVNGKDVLKLTTVKQRPIWRMFPERSPTLFQVSKRGRDRSQLGNGFVIWRWRDYYYDVKGTQADKYVGWQLTPLGGLTRPKFEPLERMQGSDDVLLNNNERAGFHKPEKVWLLFSDGLAAPDKVIFPDIQPPHVKLDVVTKPGKNSDLVIDVTIQPLDTSPKQRLSQKIHLWINDFRRETKELKPNNNGEIVVKNLTIRRSELRQGQNVLSLVAYNGEGARGQDIAPVDFEDGSVPQRTLRALCVGVNDYSQVKGYRFDDLNCSRNDAEEMHRVFDQHGKSKLYQKAIVHLIPEKQSSAQEIIKQIRKLGEGAKPDDWFVLFLSGHGHAERETADKYKPGSFFFLCADTNKDNKKSHLTSKVLYDELSRIDCSKMLILDCCHSGDVASNPLRDLARDGVPYLILSSCRADQVALEPKGKGKHGFFTQSLLDAVTDSTKARGKARVKPVSSDEMRRVIVERLKQYMKQYKVDEDEHQVPEFSLPPELLREAVLAKP